MRNLFCFLSIISVYVWFTEADWDPPRDECPEWYKPCIPTITEIECDIERDSASIYGYLTDGRYSDFAQIFVRRTNKQIRKIESAYYNRTKDELWSLIKDKLPKGHLKNLLIGIRKPLHDFIYDDLKELHGSRGYRNNVEEYLDTIGVLSSKWLSEMPYRFDDRNNYDTKYLNHFSTSVMSFLDTIGRGNRPEVENGTVWRNVFPSEISWLKNTVSIKGVDSRILAGIIRKNHDLDLRALYRALEEERGHSYLEDLTNNNPAPDTDPLLHRAVISMYKITKNRLEYFAERLHGSLHNTTSDNYRILNRIFITRREIDLGNIKNTFEKMYDKSLASTIMEQIPKKQNTDYKIALLWLIQEKGN